MDDGYRVNRELYLSTESFTYEDNLLLVEMLKKNFNLKSSVHYHTNGHRIYIYSSEREKLLTLIKP